VPGTKKDCKKMELLVNLINNVLSVQVITFYGNRTSGQIYKNAGQTEGSVGYSSPKELKCLTVHQVVTCSFL
jgi:hypothetical protein